MLGVWVANLPKQLISVWFDGKLATHLSWMGCQQITQWVHLYIHLMLLLLLFHISTISKSQIQHRITTFCFLLQSAILIILYYVYFPLQAQFMPIKVINSCVISSCIHAMPSLPNMQDQKLFRLW